MFRIGEVAKRAGVSVDAVRYYERCGLLRAVGRTEAGYRLFAPETISRIRFIKRAQGLGFSLSEVAELLSLAEHPAATCGEVRAQVLTKLRVVERKLERLAQLRERLLQLAEQCEGGSLPAERCSILLALTEEDPCASG
ncbi:MAG: heavy metal-responsive transcriptional regulator [Candidatus Poribacteria bacterium]|nr:MAG: heavy metal-responsive transcriptional regulator [Candidatus Poribacteria bacterium]